MKCPSVVRLRRDFSFRTQLYFYVLMPHTHTPLIASRAPIHTLDEELSQMPLLSMNEITTFRWSLEEDVENYLEAGYSAIGLWRNKVCDGDENRAIDLLAGSGLGVTHLSWAGGFTGNDGRTFAESVDDVNEALRLAAATMARCLVVYPGGRNNHTFRHAGRLLRAALDQILPLAEDLKFPIALEPMYASCAKDWTFLTDLDSILSLIREYESPYLKIAYDTFHFPINGRHRDVLGRLVSHIGIVHLGDRRCVPTMEQERCPLGYGRIPLGDIIGTLVATGYSGAFDVKLCGSEIETINYWTLLEQSQRAFGELAPVAAQRTLA